MFLIFRVISIFLDKRSELSCCFIEASSEIGRKIKYLQAKQSKNVSEGRRQGDFVVNLAWVPH